MAAPDRTVALLFHEGQTGGASLFLVRVLPELERRGWRVISWVDSPSRLRDMLDVPGRTIEGRPRQVGFSRRWWRHPPGVRAKARTLPAWFSGLAGFLRREQPALVHSNSLYSLPDALVARAVGLPVFIMLQEMLPANRKGALARQAMLRSGIRVGVASKACGDAFGPAEPPPTIVLGATEIPDHAAERPRDPSPAVVGTMGWISERKGSDLFVDAARLVRRERPDVEFRLVGSNDPTAPQFDWGEALLQRAAGEGVVHIPYADAMAEFPRWDIMVLPSRYDPYPITVMEAMACGVPVVGAAVDGIKEQIAPGTGVLVPPEDPRAIAGAVLELLADGDRRHAMAAAARARAESHFTIEQQADALEAAWLATIDARSRSRASG